jgi:hypothetical protein
MVWHTSVSIPDWIAVKETSMTKKNTGGIGGRT